MPLASPPLDTREHAQMALSWLRRFGREEWPRILGAAVAYDIIPPARARELLMEGERPAQWWCTACNSSQSITCPWCEADACASCWTCVTPGCGADMPARRKLKPLRKPKVVTGRGVSIGRVTLGGACRLYYSNDGEAWESLGNASDINITGEDG